MIFFAFCSCAVISAAAAALAAATVVVFIAAVVTAAALAAAIVSIAAVVAAADATVECFFLKKIQLSLSFLIPSGQPPHGAPPSARAARLPQLQVSHQAGQQPVGAAHRGPGDDDNTRTLTHNKQ